jgi:RNA polymerase sigma-70 factor, ECF subfamily
MDPSCETVLLVRRAIEGDALATGELMTRYRSPLRRMVAIHLNPRLKARFDPSDIVQCVLAQAARRIPELSESRPSRFYPWLRQLAWDHLARLHRDHVYLQKRSVRREVQDWRDQIAENSACALVDHVAACQLGPQSGLERDELRSRVRQALTELPRTDREVLELRFLERLDLVETAEALGITTGAVKSRQFRAIERLSRELADIIAGDEK